MAERGFRRGVIGLHAFLGATMPVLALHAGSLQDRIDTAEPGAAVVVEGGRFEEDLVLRNPVTLIGLDDPEIRGTGQGHVIHVLAPDVRIEGFSIAHSGDNLSADHAAIFIEADRVVVAHNRISDALHGVYVKQADSCRIEGNRIRGKTEKFVPLRDVMREGIRPVSAELCAVPIGRNQRGNGIHLWNSAGILVEGNRITGTRDGIYFSFTDRSVVRRNGVADTRYGLHYMYSDENVFEGNRFEENAAGAALMYSRSLLVRDNHFTGNQGHRAYGVLMQSVDDSIVRENRITRNTVGLFLENANGNAFAENRIESNYIAARMTASSAGNRFTRNVLGENLHNVEFDQEPALNHWASAEGVGNRWSGTTPVDLNRDGVGEFPHFETDLLGGMRRSFPAIGLLSGSAATAIIRFMEQKTRLPGVPSLVDPAPLTADPQGDGGES